MKHLFLSFIFLFTTYHALAQTGVISGKIIDRTNAPLEAVTVSVLELQTSVLTSSEGLFKIAAVPPGEYTVQFSPRPAPPTGAALLMTLAALALCIIGIVIYRK